MSELIIYSNGIIFCSVCTDIKDVEEITKEVNRQNPTGLEHGWRLAEEKFIGGEDNPCVCGVFPETHKHYLFCC